MLSTVTTFILVVHSLTCWPKTKYLQWAQLRNAQKVWSVWCEAVQDHLFYRVSPDICRVGPESQFNNSLVFMYVICDRLFAVCCGLVIG